MDRVRGHAAARLIRGFRVVRSGCCGEGASAPAAATPRCRVWRRRGARQRPRGRAAVHDRPDDGCRVYSGRSAARCRYPRRVGGPGPRRAVRHRLPRSVWPGAGCRPPTGTVRVASTGRGPPPSTRQSPRPAGPGRVPLPRAARQPPAGPRRSSWSVPAAVWRAAPPVPLRARAGEWWAAAPESPERRPARGAAGPAARGPARRRRSGDAPARPSSCGCPGRPLPSTHVRRPPLPTTGTRRTGYGPRPPPRTPPPADRPAQETAACASPFSTG